MKNIFILTQFEADTLQAMKTAAYMSENKGNIILVTCSEISDSITELLFLSAMYHIDLNKRQDILDKWSVYKAETNIATTVREHHQFGISRPVIQKLLESFQVDVVIAPLSIQQSKQYIHKLFLKLLHNSNCPLLLLPEKDQTSEIIQRALFLDANGKSLAPSLQQLPFHVIHQSMIKEYENQSLNVLVDQLRVDLIVQPKRSNEVAEKNADVTSLGLPVLTI
jgi:hypothetical protein